MEDTTIFSRRLSVMAVEEAGRLLYDDDHIPEKMPILKGDYHLIAILAGRIHRFGQFVHNPNFYRELVANRETARFSIEALYSVHHSRIASLPEKAGM